MDERYHMLKMVSRVSDRKILFEELANREFQQEQYNKGKVKGLIDRILHDDREVNKIDKVVLQEGERNDYRASRVKSIARRKGLFSSG